MGIRHVRETCSDVQEIIRGFCGVQGLGHDDVPVSLGTGPRNSHGIAVPRIDTGPWGTGGNRTIGAEAVQYRDIGFSR